MITTAPVSTGALPLAERSLAPDLARGAMLLLIAVVHAFGYAFGRLPGTVLPAGGAADSVTVGVMALFAESRGFPMFAALYGYGLVLILGRLQRTEQDWLGTRGVLRRRGWWLLAFGAVHGILLYSGDFLGVYGLLALLFSGTLRWDMRRLLRHAVAWTVLGLLAYTGLMFYFGSLLPAGGSAPQPGTSPLADLAGRVFLWPIRSLCAALELVGAMLFGIWAGRRGLLTQPERHGTLFRRTAVFGVGASVLGGVPLLLVYLGLLGDPAPMVEGVAYWLHYATGYAGAFGYVALIALASIRLSRRGTRGQVTRALVACGQWSMTCYVFQSVAWFVLFYGYTLNLTDALSVTGTVLVGVGVWLASVLLAAVGARAGRRGPLETALRRLTYGGVAR